MGLVVQLAENNNATPLLQRIEGRRLVAERELGLVVVDDLPLEGLSPDRHGQRPGVLVNHLNVAVNPILFGRLRLALFLRTGGGRHRQSEQNRREHPHCDGHSASHTLLLDGGHHTLIVMT